MKKENSERQEQEEMKTQNIWKVQGGRRKTIWI